jgi:phosphoglycolate phosphatase
MTSELNISKYKHIIWDWNGTILNDVEYCAQIMNKLLIKYLKPGLTLEKYKSVFTFPVEDYYKIIGWNFDEISFEVIGKEFMDEYEANKFSCKTFPGVIGFLEYFRKNEIKQSILSAYFQPTLEEIISHYGLNQYFIHLAGLNNIYAGGKSELGRNLINKIDHRPSEILLIGDTTHDFDVAEELNIDCVLIASGHQSFERLKDLPVHVFKDLFELRTQLNNREIK